jgi:hypothetical protein
MRMRVVRLCTSHRNLPVALEYGLGRLASRSGVEFSGSVKSPWLRPVCAIGGAGLDHLIGVDAN